MDYKIDNKSILICSIILTIFAIFIVLIILQFSQNHTCNPCIQSEQNKVEKMDQTVQETPQITQETQINHRQIPKDALYESAGLIQSYNPINNDLVRQYDIRKAFDPLEEPTRRVARHEIHPLHLKRLIDFPTRGYPDNFTQIGILVKEGHSHKNYDNKILRLFGRQEFPGSNRYEYYTSINSGNDSIKIPIDVRQQELYDDDVVFIKELKDKYRVNLHKYDAPKYYPDLIY